MNALNVLGLISLAGLAAVWVVYPATMGLLARSRRTRLDPMDSLPSVSIVIASREPQQAILSRIENCLQTDYPADQLEVIVAHGRGMPAPDLGALGTHAVSVRAIEADAGGGKASALNAAVRAANGNVLLFADTYQRFDRNTIPHLVSALQQPGVGAASGSLQLPGGTGWLVSMYWAAERWLRNAEALVHSAVGVTGAVWAMHRWLWNPLPSGLILDDVYTPMRIVIEGHRIAFSEHSRAWELRTPTAAQEYARKVRTLTGVIQLCAWLPAVLAPARNPIWTQFVFHKLLRLGTPYLITLIGLWTLVSLASMLGPVAAVGFPVAIGVFGVALRYIRHPIADGVRRLAHEGVLLQLAVLRAGLNGVRGHWEVWDA